MENWILAQKYAIGNISETDQEKSCIGPIGFGLVPLMTLNDRVEVT